MASVIRIVDRQTVEAEAAAWLAQLDGGALSRADRAAFGEWLDRSPEHRESLLRMARMWSGIDDMIEARIERAVSDSAGATSKRGGVVGALARLYPARAAAAFAAVLCAVALVATISLQGPFRAHAPAKAVYAAAIGEQKHLTLEDGSLVRINTGSSIEVDFSPAERSVRLLEGEAWFDVAHNVKQPFVVYAGDGAVRAVGTSFAVRKRDGVVDVTVTDGRVVLSTIRREDDSEPSPFPLATLEAGHQASFDEQVESVDRLESAEIERRLSWREGFLRFDGEPLGDVVQEIGRYTTVTIEIENDALRDLRVGGYFQTGDIDTMLEVLERSFGVAHRWEGKEVVLLSSAE